jgi:hypothetical protein
VTSSREEVHWALPNQSPAGLEGQAALVFITALFETGPQQLGKAPRLRYYNQFSPVWLRS